MSTLVLLRHGESAWNADDRFAGWIDVPLTAAGRGEATSAGELLASAGILPDVVFTSLLRRAITTAALAMDTCDRHWIPAHRSWRLNERHYGALQGRTRPEILSMAGEAQFDAWRRSYDAAPPPIDDAALDRQAGDPRYRDVAREALPRTESLAAVTARLLPYWDAEIAPELSAGRCVCVVAHGNSLRALVRHLDARTDVEFAGLNIPTGIPLIYELAGDGTPARRGGRYLDPDRAAVAIDKVARQGRPPEQKWLTSHIPCPKI